MNMHSWLNRMQLLQRPSWELSKPEHRIYQFQTSVSISSMPCHISLPSREISSDKVSSISNPNDDVPSVFYSNDRRWPSAAEERRPGRQLAHGRQQRRVEEDRGLRYDKDQPAAAEGDTDQVEVDV